MKNKNTAYNYEKRLEYRSKKLEAGLCRDCNNPVEEGYKTCAACRAKAKQRAIKRKKDSGVNESILKGAKDRYNTYKAMGICTCCGKNNAVPGQVLCEACKRQKRITQKRKDISEVKLEDKKRAESHKRLYYLRKSQGLCVKCGEKALPGLVLCWDCRTFISQYKYGQVKHTEKWYHKEKLRGRLYAQQES